MYNVYNKYRTIAINPSDFIKHNIKQITLNVLKYYFRLDGSKPASLQITESIISSAPPPMEVSRESRYILLIRVSALYPIPPQHCRHESDTSLAKRPVFYFAMLASKFTSSPLVYKSMKRNIHRMSMTPYRQFYPHTATGGTFRRQ